MGRASHKQCRPVAANVHGTQCSYVLIHFVALAWEVCLPRASHIKPQDPYLKSLHAQQFPAGPRFGRDIDFPRRIASDIESSTDGCCAIQSSFANSRFVASPGLSRWAVGGQFTTAWAGRHERWLVAITIAPGPWHARTAATSWSFA